MIHDIKKEFPVCNMHPKLVYLDTAASSLTPQCVIDALNSYYLEYPVNVHRGLYALSDAATQAYNAARQTIAGFIGAKEEETIFTSGTTTSLNIAAEIFGRDIVRGQNIVLTRYEHNAQLLPWQRIAKRTGAELRYIDLTEQYEIDLEHAERVIDKKTAVVAFASISNTLGTITPSRELISLAKRVGAKTVIDAAQEVAHRPINVHALGCDALAFSGHKMYGPTGIGVLYLREEHARAAEPVIVGGGIVRDVAYDNATWADAPLKFEPGTPHIAGAIGLDAAARFILDIGFDRIALHEDHLSAYLTRHLPSGTRVIGPAHRAGVTSFMLGTAHPHDVAEILGRSDVAVRAGRHCTHPLFAHLGLTGTVRASFGVYTTESDIDALCTAIAKAERILT